MNGNNDFNPNNTNNFNAAAGASASASARSGTCGSAFDGYNVNLDSSGAAASASAAASAFGGLVGNVGNTSTGVGGGTLTSSAGITNHDTNNNTSSGTSSGGFTTMASTTASAALLDSEIGEGALRLADELRPYVPQNTLPETAGTADLQLTICRKLRELLPSNKDLLQTAQDRNWIPTLLTWLNLHDRPAVQVEALLALTNIAELCAQQSYLAQAQQQTSAVAAAAQAAVSAVKGWNVASAADAMEKFGAAAASTAAAAGNKYYNPITPAPGSVPFPPLSFSQTLSPEAVAAFDASLSSTIAGTSGGTVAQAAAAAAALAGTTNLGVGGGGGGTTGTGGIDVNAALSAAAAGNNFDLSNNNNGSASWGVPQAPLFPTNPMSAGSNGTGTQAGIGGLMNSAISNLAGLGVGGGGASAGGSGTALPAVPGNPQGINFSSLAPPPGGAHTSVPSNAFLPPPTPVTAPAFPQQLSASSQHLLLRHADAIPTLISLLSSPNREVYEQAVWILGSIAAGDSPGAAAAAAAASNSSNASNNNANGINDSSTNNSGKSVSARDVILAAGIMSQLLRCLESHPNNLSLQRIGSWTLSNLVDGIFQQSTNSSSSHGGTTGGKNVGSNNKSSGGSGGSGGGAGGTSGSDYSSADEIDMNTLLPVLRRLLSLSDAEVLGYTCWTLSHLCDGPSSHIAAVVTTPDNLPHLPKGGLVPRLVELLLHPSWRVTKPALRTIGNIVCAECSDDNHSNNNTGGGNAGAGGGGNAGGGHSSNSTSSSASATTDYTEVILECDAVPRLKELVTHSNREIQKEACWTLSNIAAGTVDQIQAVIDSGAIPPLVKLVRDKKTDQEVRSEACWVVLNATSCGSDSQIEVLVDEGCVSVLGVLLSEASMVMMALEGLERVLQVEETREMIRREQIESGELEDTEQNRTPTLVSASLIEKARESHTSSAVTKRADRIWKQHFVSCALCKKSFSKHRASDARFCEECKCHVCSNCNCKIYHLDYQEELWAATEEKTEAKKNAKKSKNKKKKAKLKERKAKQQQDQDFDDSQTFGKDKASSNSGHHHQQAKAESAASESSDFPEKKGSNSSSDKGDESYPSENKESKQDTVASKEAPVNQMKSPSPSFDDEDLDDDNGADDAQNNIDFVLYLQQTGSIIALAKLMDALEYAGEDYDEELNDYERKMIREQQILREQQHHHQATSSAH